MQPVLAESPFLDDDAVRRRLEEARGVQFESSACSQFRAAKLQGKRAQYYDVLGMAAAVCR